MNMEIKLHHGIDDIAFGMPVEDIVSHLGNPDEVENIDNAADESTTVLRYNELGLTLFYEGDNTMLAMHGVILGEEQYCERTYGDAYRQYKHRVPRYMLFF